MHRPLCPTGADHLLVRDALADGGHFSGSAPAARVRNPAALVGAIDREDCSGAVGALLAGYSPRTPANGTEHGNRPPGGVVRQAVPDLLRCSGAGEKGVVVAGDFLRVAIAGRHGKSPTGVVRAANRGGLLCSVMAKVELSARAPSPGRLLPFMSSWTRCGASSGLSVPFLVSVRGAGSARAGLRR